MRTQERDGQRRKTVIPETVWFSLCPQLSARLSNPERASGERHFGRRVEFQVPFLLQTIKASSVMLWPHFISATSAVTPARKAPRLTPPPHRHHVSWDGLQPLGMYSCLSPTRAWMCGCVEHAYRVFQSFNVSSP